jgi:hypothetical protein
VLSILPINIKQLPEQNKHIVENSQRRFPWLWERKAHRVLRLDFQGFERPCPLELMIIKARIKALLSFY